MTEDGEEPEEPARSKFDPEPDKPYAHCLGLKASEHDNLVPVECGFEAVDKAALDAHLKEVGMTETGTTMGVTARGHSYRVTNPSRPERIASALQREVNDGIDELLTDVIDEAWKMIEREGVTREEITSALGGTVYGDIDLAEAWAENLEENS